MTDLFFHGYLGMKYNHRNFIVQAVLIV